MRKVKSRGSTDREALKRQLRGIRDGDKCREVDGGMGNVYLDAVWRRLVTRRVDE
jgi:hypothetical protein